MPPRPFVVLVVLGWLAATGWLVADKWLPWWRPAEQPPFAVELADEVAPEHATWLVYKKDKRIGSAETRMSPRKDGLFELTTRLRDLDLSRSYADVRIPSFATTRTVTRDGDLVTLDAKAVMVVKLKGLDVDQRIEAVIRGRVVGDELRGECEFDAGDGPAKEPLAPIKLTSKNAFSPLQPLQKYPPLRPGQTWRVSNLDPVSEAMNAAVRQIASKKWGLNFSPPEQPKELRAEVQKDTEEVVHRDKTYTCRVILFEGDRMSARTWVDVADGKVVRQEATGMGETVRLQRD